MHKYSPEEVPTDLTPWPFSGEASNYRILRGQPRASGRLDQGRADGQHRLGIWSCTEGAFECTELGDELQTILKGRVRIGRTDGGSHEFGPGESFFTRKGERLVWDVIEDVTKVFFTYNADGTPDTEAG